MIEYIVLGFVAIVIVAGVVAFGTWFAWPSWQLASRLDRATASLKAKSASAKQQGLQHVVDVAGIRADLIDAAPELDHLWKEFRDTLHEETGDVDSSGQLTVTRYRQTAPAEMFFSTRAVADVPLRTDFFKHLPGILTGVGIIGTFSGLIYGLAQFKFSGTANEVSDSVDTLIEAVGNAFIVSAAAILSAMIITSWEKISVTRRYAQVQKLQQAIDAMFDAGAGEDYLSTIAEKSEKSATDMAQLRQGLIDGLTPLLERQTEAIRASSAAQVHGFEKLGGRHEAAIEYAARRQEEAAAASADAMASAVSATFEAPLTSMTRAIEKSQEDQATSVQRLLDASLDTFATRLDELVGAKLTGAAGHIETAAGRMSEAMADAPAQLEQSVARVGAMLEEIGEGAEASVARMATATEAATASIRGTLEDMSRTTEEASSRIRNVLEAVAASAEPMAEHTARMAEAAETLADAVGRSAETWDYAIERLKAVNAGLDGSVEASERLAAAITEAGKQAEAGSAAFEDATVRLEDTAKTIAQTSGALQEVLGKHEADREIYRELAGAVAEAASQLNRAQADVDSFLAGIADALAETSSAFGRQLTATLSQAQSETHQHLGVATERIAGAVGGFTDFLDRDFSDSLERLREEIDRLSPDSSANGS